MRFSILVLTLVLALLGVARPATAQTLTKQFTYQGYLENSGVPYTGTATVTFRLFNALTGGTNRAGVNVANVVFNKGVFSATVNFGETDTAGQQIYDGRALYLEVSVTFGSNVIFLTPRQLIQPAPVALSLPNVTPVGSNVGIGTTSPSSTLDVNGEMRSTTLEVTNGVILKGGSSSPATTDLGLYSLNSGAWLRLVSNNAPIQFFTSSTQGSAATPTANSSAMTIDPSGNVGIGTGSPGTKLHVNSGGIRLSNGPTQLDFTSGAGSDILSNRDLYINATQDTTRGHIIMQSNANAFNVGIGITNPTEKLHVNGNIRAKVIIIEGGSDLAESYDVAPAGDAKPMPGMVVSIDAGRVGKLQIATKAYDRAVAGIISGADGVAPGLILGQKGTVADGEHPIANAGRVWCYVDADAGGPIVPGDLLTTSATPGHAMKAADQSRASGATLGKAMSRLESGKGLVLVLVTLQ